MATLNIYSNDGNTLLYTETKSGFVAGVWVVNDGIMNSAESLYLWKYEGSGTFLGVANEPNATTPITTPKSEINFNGTYYVVVQEAPQPSTPQNIKIGSSNVNIKVGETQVSKVYKGSSLIWEKGEPTPSGFTLTISGVYDFSGGDNYASKITIDNITSSVDIYGNATNIPHTFNNITEFEVLPNNEALCSFKLISGSGTAIFGYGSETQTLIPDTIYASYSRYLITLSSDAVIQLGYWED